MRQRVRSLPWVEIGGSLILIVVIGIAVTLINLRWPWEFRFKYEAQLVQSLVTAGAILLGGFYTLRRLQIFRTFEPHLTITHRIGHRSVGTQYIHIDATATLNNTSKVAVSIRQGLVSLQLISPTADNEIERLYAEVFEDRKQDDIQWPVLLEVSRQWAEKQLIVEPGESHHETFEFLIASGVESVSVYTYFNNPQYEKSSQSTEGWSATTIYDIVVRKHEEAVDDDDE